MRRCVTGLLCFLCAFLIPLMVLDVPAFADEAEEALSRMSLHEKVCQLFIVLPEQLSGTEKVTAGTGALNKGLQRYPVGGVILFPANMVSGSRLTGLNAFMQTCSLENTGIGLLIGVDEEGGGVSRVANTFKLRERQQAASAIGRGGDAKAAYRAGLAIGKYLSRYGFNLDFAPVMDVRSDVRDAEITLRAFSKDPRTVGEMGLRFMEGLRDHDIISVMKHFPGHGAVSGNTHDGQGTSLLTVEDWRNADWLPFRAGIEAGAEMMMISHQVAVNVDAERPASLSPLIVTGLLRGELGFDGVAVTDALRMGAIKKSCSTAEACVMALEAGCDMLLMPSSLREGYTGVMDALASGRLTEERIDESVRRILRMKDHHGLIDVDFGAAEEPDEGPGPAGETESRK